MKRILAFCFFPAFVPPTNGGQSRLFHFYRALANWHHVTLLTSTHIGVDEEVINHGLNFIERRVPKDDHFIQAYRRIEQYSGGGDLSGPAIAACGGMPTRLHHAYLEEYQRADIIFHDFPFTVDYDLFAGADHKPRVYNAHNCETDLYKQLHPSDQSRPIHELVRGAEQRMLQGADLVLYCNDGDLAAFKQLVPDAGFAALYAPNGMSYRSGIDAGLKRSNGAARRAVFMGSGHPPNARAANFIASTLAPAIPEIEFNIVGNCLGAGDYTSNLKRHGLVDESTKARILAEADLALNPMEEGSGSNVKVLEYFAHGLPVLSTSFGMRGINAKAGIDYFQGSLDEFANELRQAARDPRKRAAIGEAGRALALDKYTWESIASAVAERVTTLIEDKRTSDRRRIVLALNDYDSFAGVGGGGTRTRGLYEAVRHWCPVVFLSYSGDGKLSKRHGETGITIITVPKTSDHISDQQRVNAQFYISADDIVATRHCLENPWLSAIYAVLRQSARCVVVEHCYLAGLPLLWGDRFVYSSQNNETELKKSLLEWHPLKAELLPVVEEIERRAVEQAAAVIAVSHDDAEALTKGKRTAGPVIVVRNGANSPAEGEAVEQAKIKLREQVGARSVAFLGSAHMPNVEAAQFIVEKLAPECPNVHFHLLGSVCDSVLKPPSNVHLWGVVDEVTKSAVLQSCALALNPMISGSGSNVKLADYLGNGLFVISTEFGQRGYPSSIQPHTLIVSLEQFADAIQEKIADLSSHSTEAKVTRRALFENELAMKGLAQRFVDTLRGFERSKKRILYVAYRYAHPALGGAEVNIEKFVSALGRSGLFDIDVVAPEVTGIHNEHRFSERYSFDPGLGVTADIPNVRFARFPVDVPAPEAVWDQLRKAWSVQPLFERYVDQSLSVHYSETGLSWGWAYPEGVGAMAARWAFVECGMHLQQAGKVVLEGFVAHSATITAYSGEQVIGGPWIVQWNFSLSFDAERGNVRFVTSTAQQAGDPRPLGFRVVKLTISNDPLDLSAPTVMQRHLSLLPAEQSFRLLDSAANASRTPLNVRLTDGRGPWSSALEHFVVNHVAEYDLLITHNNVFRPAVYAIEAARKLGVPSILIPHAHLDDDFYHFPDLLESARGASLVLAAPKVACEFLLRKGCNARYLPAGCDATEQFTERDIQIFRQVHPSERPFVLILGRKAGAKGYREILRAVEQLNSQGLDLQAVLIGPDDDGIELESPNAVYLGRQPRDVVRGALQSCIALCNMSTSESFGIVLLEAWLAGKPVIANRNCAAFHDIATDSENAILVDFDQIVSAIRRICSDPELSERLARNGKELARKYDWKSVAADFVNTCEGLLNESASILTGH